jgi:hypothetical protein
LGLRPLRDGFVLAGGLSSCIADLPSQAGLFLINGFTAGGEIVRTSL